MKIAKWVAFEILFLAIVVSLLLTSASAFETRVFDVLILIYISVGVGVSYTARLLLISMNKMDELDKLAIPESIHTISTAIGLFIALGSLVFSLWFPR